MFLIDLIDNCLSKNNNSNNVLADYSLWISEMNDSNVIRDKRGNWESSVIRFISNLWSSINRLTLVVKKYNQWAKRKWNNIKCSIKNREGRVGGSRAVWGHFTSCVQGGFLRFPPLFSCVNKRRLPPLGVSRRPLEGSVPDGSALHCSHSTWLKSTSDGMKKQIYKLAKKGLPQSDPEMLTWHCSVTGNKILRILKFKGLPPDLPEDL